MAASLRLKRSNCKNCYRCIRHCPVKSIRFSAGQAHILEEDCILCGHCFVECPQNAKEIVDGTEQVNVLLSGDDPVIASLAPSFAANYEGVGIEAMRDALRALGFADAEETALGATMVKREYERMLREERREVVLSSCCHSVNLLIRKYFPEQLSFLADVVSPMQAHCMDIKRRIPHAKTVFIGPCVAKKDEAQEHADAVDAVLTFEELTRWMQEAGVEPERRTEPCRESRARFFPTTGGILKTMDQDAPGWTYLALDGVDTCVAALRDIAQGKLSHCFVEMSACTGGCVGGPVMEKYHRSPVRDYLAIAASAGPEDFPVPQPDAAHLRQAFTPLARHCAEPDEEELRAILRETGKSRPEDELNCGSCGYSTCRDKAAAIFQGKAERSMCLPFLKEKAEQFSDTIVHNSPNAVVVLNERLEVQQLNTAALRLLHLRKAADILGGQVVRVLEPDVFEEVLRTQRRVTNRRVYLAEYERYVEQTVVPAEEGRMLLCIMRDVTDEENARRRKEEISRETVQVADKVVDKQMHIVQEIASLLGETAAETKVALAKLKESISDE